MQKVTNSAQLKQSIKELESRTRQQEIFLKEELKATGSSIKESIQPGNLLKSGLRAVRSTPGVGTIALNTFIGLAAGFVTRRFFIGNSRNILKRTLGAAVQAGITKMVHKNLPTWKQKAANFIARKTQNNRPTILHRPNPRLLKP